MSKFTSNLWSDLVQEHGAALAHADRPEPGRARRPRILAGSTLALAGVGAALALVLTSTSGTPASAAVTVAKTSNGSLLVTLNRPGAWQLIQAGQKLAAMGLNEQIAVNMGSGPATVSGPVTCTPAPGIPNQPTVEVLVGTNGTEVINPGTTPGNTGVGTFHMNSCTLYVPSATGTGNTGNTGNSGTG
jgi:hypothetical protein